MRGSMEMQMSGSVVRKMTTKHGLLDMAKEATTDRGAHYGSPQENFDRIARRWRVHILNRFGVDIALDAASVAIMCIDLKAARLEHTDHLDSIVDIAGYAACLAEIIKT